MTALFGNNFWNDTAYMLINGGGNFGGSNTDGYIGVRHFKNGSYYYAWVDMDFNSLMRIDSYGYDTVAGSPLTAGQCTTTATPIQSLSKIDVELYNYGNIMQVNLSNYAQIEEARLQVVNLSGQVMYTESLLSDNNTINLTGLQKGIYLVAIENKAGLVSKKKIFVN